MSSIKKDWLLRLVIIGLFIVGFIFYPQLPDQVPMHWNISGEVDGYGSRFIGAFGMPLMALGIYLLLVLLPKFDPRKDNYAKFTGVYELVKWLIILFLTVMYFVTISAGLGYSPNVALITKLGVGILIIVLGNYFGKIRHNYFVGIRTPWTLASEEVWAKTHRFAGPLWMSAGLIFIISAFIDHPLTFWISMGGLFTTVALTTVYSYWIFRKLS